MLYLSEIVDVLIQISVSIVFKFWTRSSNGPVSSLPDYSSVGNAVVLFVDVVNCNHHVMTLVHPVVNLQHVSQVLWTFHHLVLFDSCGNFSCPSIGPGTRWHFPSWSCWRMACCCWSSLWGMQLWIKVTWISGANNLQSMRKWTWNSCFD